MDDSEIRNKEEHLDVPIGTDSIRTASDQSDCLQSSGNDSQLCRLTSTSHDCVTSEWEDSGVNLTTQSTTTSCFESGASAVQSNDKDDIDKNEDSAVSHSPCSNELEDISVSDEKITADSVVLVLASNGVNDEEILLTSNEIAIDQNSSNKEENGGDEDSTPNADADTFNSLGLPPGWRRMSGDTGVYYWHVQSGEISRQIPEFQHSFSQPVGERTMGTSVADVPLSNAVHDSLHLPGSHSEGVLVASDSTSVSLSHSSSQDLCKFVESLEMNNRDDLQSVVFPVFGLGSCTLDKDDLQQDSSVSISTAIRSICQTNGQHCDKFYGRDFLLVLENETLQVCDYLDNCVLLAVPVSQIRLWGVGKDSGHDFAFVSKDRETGFYFCYAFRSDRSARAISTALQKLCDKIVAERAAKRRSLPANPFLQPSFENKFWNDLEPSPLPTSDNFTKQVTPLDRLGQRSSINSEECEKFHVYYIGSMPSEKPNGICSINEAIEDLKDIGAEEYIPAIVQVSPSSVLITNEETGELITESRVRYLSFLGIGRDASKFGYIVSTCRNQFICHVLHCDDSAGPLAKAVEHACKIRYQKVLEAKKRQLLAAPKLTRQQTMPNQVLSAISKTFQGTMYGGLSAAAANAETKENNSLSQTTAHTISSTNDNQSQQQSALRTSFSSLFGRLSRYTSSARMSRSEAVTRPRPKSNLYDDVIIGSFESNYDD